MGKAKKVVIFRLEESGLLEDENLSSDYEAAVALIRLAVAVAGADGEISPSEEQHLRRHVEEGLKLSPAERLRLGAHLEWLQLEPPGLAGLKKRLEQVPEAERHELAAFLLAVAAADGRFDPEEIKILRKVYPLLGLDADMVFSDAHSFMAGDEGGPVTVLTGSSASGFEIPPEASESAPPQGALILDAEKLRTMRQTTERISGVLAEIFEDEEEAEASSPLSPDTAGRCLLGLDAAHSEFLSRLMERISWQRDEIERLAQEAGVLPDGALELINEAALESYGDPLLEGDETLDLDEEILREISR